MTNAEIDFRDWLLLCLDIKEIRESTDEVFISTTINEFMDGWVHFENYYFLRSPTIIELIADVDRMSRQVRHNCLFLNLLFQKLRGLVRETKILTMKEFIEMYCKNGDLTIEQFFHNFVALPDKTSPNGWAAVSRSLDMIHRHWRLYVD